MARANLAGERDLDVSFAPDSAADVKRRPTAFNVLGALSLCHLLNDMVQSLLPAIYPILKTALDLDFGHIGLITLATSSPRRCCSRWSGYYTDHRPQPHSLAAG